MGKKRARRKGRSRTSFLNSKKALYDPYSPYALRTRGAKVINFTQPIPMTAVVKAHMEREVILLNQQSWNRQKLTEMHRLSYIKQNNYTLDLYFSGRIWIFIKRDQRKKVEARSMEYKTKIAADLDFNSDRIYWAEVLPISHPSPNPSEV